MPSITTPDGQVVYLPGVYSSFSVIDDSPGPLPEFHIPVLVGDGNQGHPHNADASKLSHEPDKTPFVLCTTTAQAREYFGEGSDIAIAFEYAKRGGMPFAYVAATNAMTRATATVASTVGPADQLDLYAKTHGPVGGWAKIAIAANNAITITPVKQYSRLSADAATAATRVYVEHNAWMQPGMDIVIGDNDAANATRTISSIGEEFDSNGQKVYFVELTAAVGADITVAAGALIVQYSTQPEQSGDLGDVQAVMDWLNSTSAHIGAGKNAAFTNADLATLASTALRSVSGATGGTAPASTVSTHNAFLAALDATEWDAFLLRVGRVPQAFYVAEPTIAVHTAWRDWAANKRSLGEAVSVTSGCAWGDVVLDAGDATDPLHRAGLLDSQDFMLVAAGADWLGSYLSRAPFVFGLRTGSGLNHNLTNDRFNFAMDEVYWNERTEQQLTALTRGGVVTHRMASSGGRPALVVSQGLSTLQSNASAWNVSTGDTCLVQQRDLADFFDVVMSRDLEETQIGGDGTDEDSVRAVLVAREDRSLRRRGYTADYDIISVELAESGNGLHVRHKARFPNTIDFITLENQIQVRR